MKHLIILLALLGFIVTSSFTTKYVTKTGTVRFYSDAPLETIEAVNKQVNAALDSESGDVLYKILIKSFLFEKALMQEHFNENYLESDKFPTAKYTAKITNLSDIKFDTEGIYDAKVDGSITIHGISRPLKTSGTIEVRKNDIHIHSVFKVNLGDFDISIPGAVTGKIAKEVEVTIDSSLKPM